MACTDTTHLSAVELARALRDREVTAVEALEAVLQRAERAAETINPFSVWLDDRARRQAELADEALARGKGGALCGVPITVKDSHWIAGISAAHGSRAHADFVPGETCAAVQRLEAAGAVIYAKTAVPEFCYSGITESELCGRTNNPWNLARTPGGSSGGSGAAVAAGLGPLSLGGDGGGSIRIPSAFCGIVGFKPTFGLVPREPCAPGWKTLVSIGPMARTVADARLMLGTVAGMHAWDRHSLGVEGLASQGDWFAAGNGGRPRVVASADLGFAPLDDDVRRGFHAAVETIATAGIEVVWDDPGLESSVRTWATIACADARAAEWHAFENHRDKLMTATLDFIAFGDRITAEEYISAQYRREEIHRAYADLFQRTGAAALVTPTVGCEAFAHGARHPAMIGDAEIAAPWMDWAGFLYDANLAGLPACALPIGLGDEGLPISMQLLGPRGADVAVLDMAARIESALALPVRIAPPCGEVAASPS